MRGGKVDALPPPLPKPQPSEKNSQDKQLTPLPKLNPRLRLVAGQVRRHAHAHGGLHAREEEHARGRGDEQPRARARPGPVLGVPRAPGCGCLVAAPVAWAGLGSRSAVAVDGGSASARRGSGPQGVKRIRAVVRRDRYPAVVVERRGGVYGGEERDGVVVRRGEGGGVLRADISMRYKIEGWGQENAPETARRPWAAAGP
jgi:hypothetical protein